MKRYTLKKIQEYAKRPRFKDLLSMGTIEGELFLIEDEVAKELFRPENLKRNDYPPINIQFKNVVMASGRIIKAAFKGEQVRRPAEEVERITAICKKNECGSYDAKQERCMSCGCSLGIPLVNKTTWATEKCPKGFW